jgi:hypothetical protein
VVCLGTVIMSEPKSIFSSMPGAIVAVGTACVLLVGACVVCGGVLSFPIMLRSQRQAEEAQRREQTEHYLRQVHEALQKKQATQGSEDSKPAPGDDAANPSPE